MSASTIEVWDAIAHGYIYSSGRRKSAEVGS